MVSETKKTKGTKDIRTTREFFYQIDGKQENWYTAKPYSFLFSSRSGSKYEFPLPILPSNLTITTHFATNVISTMYGTVEEHSEQRYFDIMISGTTGMVPQYNDIYEKTTSNDKKKANNSKKKGNIGRAGFAIRSQFSSNPLGGFLKRQIDLAENFLSNAADAIAGTEKQSTGVDLNKTGYVAFHNLYRFLLEYKRDSSGETSTRRRSKHPLTFRNYKDNNEYDVAVNSFTLTRDPGSPMMYNYSISMRAYNIRTLGSTDPSISVSSLYEALGLVNGNKDGGVENSSKFSKMSDKFKQAKNAVYSALGAAKGLGF
jgi:hypothetical protein